MTQEKTSVAFPVTAELPTFQSRRLYKQIAEALAQRIQAGVFPPGSYLPSERDLAQQMGVSRPSVREALIALEVMGMVSVRVGDGVQVCSPQSSQTTDTASENSPLEQLQARVLLEGEVAALAAANATAEQLDELETALESMASAMSEGRPFLEADRAFHFAVADASGNQVLVDLVEFLWKQRSLPVYNAFEKHFTGANEQRKVLSEHKAIFTAIKEQDAGGARVAMRRHIERVRTQLLR